MIKNRNRHDTIRNHLPSTQEEIRVNYLFLRFKEQYNATLIGIRRDKKIKLNPPLDSKIMPNDVIFYISSARITHLSWT